MLYTKSNSKCLQIQIVKKSNVIPSYNKDFKTKKLNNIPKNETEFQMQLNMGKKYTGKVCLM